MMRIIYAILFTITVFLIGCYTVHLETFSDDPILKLKQKYSVHLNTAWTAKQADSLLKIFESFSTDLNSTDSTDSTDLNSTDLNFHPSIWKISGDLEEDIKIKFQNSLKFVTISSDVFPIEGYKGILAPDKRLFQAVVQFVTEGGTNRSAIKQILQERYGISIETPSYEVLTKGNTKETGVRLSNFENEDLMTFISILEEFPQALHKVTQLKYLVCRADDNMNAAARAWTTLNFIEVAESVFDNSDFKYICHIMVHEKAHFLWTHFFPAQLKGDWMKLGGWQKDSNSESGWSTTKDRKEFVSDYAHEKNPNEDMAESLGFYLVFPDKLRACNPVKYDFIHERIMLTYGARYVPPDRM